MSSGTDIYHEMIVDYSRNPINYGEIEDHDVHFMIPILCVGIVLILI